MNLKMKKKISVSVEEKTILKLNDFVSEGSFRNKSHVVEFAINRLIKQQNESNSAEAD